MFAFLFAAMVSVPSPAPSAEPKGPLKEIGRVHATSPFCLALKQSIAPSLSAVVDNDRLLISSQRVFLKLALDLGDRRTKLERVPSVNIAIVRLSAAADALRANASAIERFISALPDPPDPDALVHAGNPLTPATTELGEIKRQLAGIAAVQHAQSDQIFEVADTMRMGQMRLDIVKVNAVTDPSKAMVNADLPGNSEFTAARLQDTSVPGSFSDVQMLDSTLFGHTVYDLIGYNIASVQAVTVGYERRLGTALLSDVDSRCGDGQDPSEQPLLP